MWKPSKKILFILMLSCSTLGGISMYFIDWNVFETGSAKDIYYEIITTIIFLASAFLFMFPYLKKLKEESKQTNI